MQGGVGVSPTGRSAVGTAARAVEGRRGGSAGVGLGRGGGAEGEMEKTFTGGWGRGFGVQAFVKDGF